VVYILGFLFTLHSVLPTYINSTFLSKYTTEELVGFIYTISSIITIIAFFSINKILRKYGNYKTTLILLFLELISLIGLAIFSNIFALTALFVIGFMAVALTGFTIDIVLESYSKNEKTGEIRGWYLATSNLAWVFGPAISSFIMTNGDYWKIFTAGAILLIPVIYLFINNMKDFKDPEYPTVPLFQSVKKIWADNNIFSILATSFLLQFFYAWMVIYTPIYLHEHIGFNWQQIGIIFSIMLFPFVLTEIPLGKLADAKFGEKEMLSIGFIIMALSTGLISFVFGANMILWAVILFITRVGASMVEVMSETYFFKKVSESDIGIISVFRTMRPLAYVISPVAASMILPFIDFRFIFIILGLLMFIGLKYSMSIEDTL